MLQKVIFLLSCLALARGGALVQPAAMVQPVVQLAQGTSAQTRTQDDHGNYNFAYDIVDEYGARNGRQESGDALGNKAGSYHIADTDGRVRRVDYVADAYGFRAAINTNEPGTAPSDPGNAAYRVPTHVDALALAPAYNPVAKLLAPLTPTHAYAAPHYAAAYRAPVAVAAPVHAPIAAPIAPLHAPVIHEPRPVALAAPVPHAVTYIDQVPVAAPALHSPHFAPHTAPYGAHHFAAAPIAAHHFAAAPFVAHSQIVSSRVHRQPVGNHLIAAPTHFATHLGFEHPAAVPLHGFK